MALKVAVKFILASLLLSTFLVGCGPKPLSASNDKGTAQADPNADASDGKGVMPGKKP